MNDTTTTTATGGCVCGAVRYELEGAALAFQYCHCSRCRKASGSAHASNLFVPADKLRVVRGAAEIKRFDLPDARYWSTAFCTACGSRVPWLTRTGKAWIVPAGSLDDDPGARPERNIYFGSRPAWYIHASELETFETFPLRDD